MIEKLYHFNQSEEKLIEKIVTEDKVNINHVILKEGDSLPEHYSNANVYLIVLRGTLKGAFNNQSTDDYPAGTIINVPYNTRMNVSNRNNSILEFFILKAPMGSEGL